MAENFDLIFGQNASQQYAWSDNDYQKGWETIGSIPPTAAQFDALQRRADTKAQELNNNLAPLVAQNTANNRQPLTTYALKDIRYSPLLPTGWFLECTVDGTTASGEITVPSPLVENATIIDGTVTWKVRKISSADGMPIGAIIAYSGNGAIPSGYLLCDGAAYSRTAFPDLFATIGTDYGSGDGSTTFNVPDSNQAKRFLQGDVTAGQTKEAGLPNIEGNFIGYDYNNDSPGSFNGAFQITGSGVIATVRGSGYPDTEVSTNFDASRSSAIYGNSTTVQPDALTTRYIIKAFDGQTADSALIDITQFENELGGKADRSLSNLTEAGKSFSFPSDTYINIPFTVDTTTLKNFFNYIAPADGFVDCIGTTSGVFSNFELRAMGSNTGSDDYTPFIISNAFAGGSIAHASIPVRKGMIVGFISTASATITYAHARFVYAQGEVPN